MIVHFNRKNNIVIRLCHVRNLIFFVLIALSSCSNNEKSTEGVSLQWQSDRAVSLTIPISLLQDFSSDSVQQLLEVRIHQSDTIGNPIFGTPHVERDAIQFEPLIPFTRGLTYSVFYRNTSIGKIEVPLADQANASSVLAVYPTQDTVPENLLKLYSNFSKPMREGESLQHVHVLKNGKDTMNVFLVLQPELWSPNSTLLTLWLDPGRIKRDLIPNKTLGIPIEKGNHYTLIISKNWLDKQGLNLQKDFTHSFFVTSRDSISPEPSNWIVKAPNENSIEPLEIDFNESLDYGLLEEVFQVLDEKGTSVRGVWVIGKEENTIQFVPEVSWTVGNYMVRVESILEDISGNNLNRPFDRDMINTKLKEPKPFYELRLQVKPMIKSTR